MKDSATPRYHDMTGQVFGRLTALRYLRSNGTNTYWLVRCLCGNEFTTQRSALVTGHTHHAGLRKHGLAGTRAHMSWISMNTRCHNPNRNNWADYGGRGISICERWRRFLTLCGYG